MQKYDFDTPANRQGSGCYKWDEAHDPEVIPMWVADMDFRVAPAITEALAKRVSHGVFGYTMVMPSYYQAIVNWFSRRHQWTINPEWIIYTTGVVPAVSCVIKALTMPGEKVLVMTPVYNCFFSSITNNGCQVEESPLRRTADSYEVDFDDFERRCTDEKVTVFLLCNPHNPAGRVWTRDELQRMNDICLRHDVTVVSDEIHCELVMPGHVFTPFAAVSTYCQDNSITLNSPSKSFNIAGLQTANIICKNAEWRRKINRAVNINEVCDVNPFGPIALEAAYNHGEEWLQQLNGYIWENYLTLKTFIKDNLPALNVLRMEGTYLPWIDITATSLTSDELTRRLLSEAKVKVNSGTMYGSTSGEGYIRLNIACPRAQLTEALQRMAPIIQSAVNHTP